MEDDLQRKIAAAKIRAEHIARASHANRSKERELNREAEFDEKGAAAEYDERMKAEGMTNAQLVEALKELKGQEAPPKDEDENIKFFAKKDALKKEIEKRRAELKVDFYG